MGRRYWQISILLSLYSKYFGQSESQRLKKKTQPLNCFGEVNENCLTCETSKRVGIQAIWSTKISSMQTVVLREDYSLYR